MSRRLFAGLLVGSALLLGLAPARASDAPAVPVRWNTGAAVWSTDLAAFTTFLETGEVTDRGLAGGLARSGWTAEEVREGLSKTYEVDFLGVSRFLYSDQGEAFLKNQTTSYIPYLTLSEYAVQALRSAIIADARDGQISSAGIMANLPVDMRLADFCGTYSGAQNVCAEGRCQGEAQCTSLLSWYVFLPACIQANQLTGAPVTARQESAAPPARSAPIHSAPIRGLW